MGYNVLFIIGYWSPIKTRRVIVWLQLDIGVLEYSLLLCYALMSMLH